MHSYSHKEHKRRSKVRYHVCVMRFEGPPCTTCRCHGNVGQHLYKPGANLTRDLLCFYRTCRHEARGIAASVVCWCRRLRKYLDQAMVSLFDVLNESSDFFSNSSSICFIPSSYYMYLKHIIFRVVNYNKIKPRARWPSNCLNDID